MDATIGRIVHYQLSEQDAAEINRRRADYRAFAAGHAHPHEPGQPDAPGYLAHVGNSVNAGDVYPAMVVRVFEGYDGVNLQVALDGNDCFWATSRHEGDEHGQW